jgi:hypothetical protein
VKIYNSAGEFIRALWIRPANSWENQDLSWDGKNMNGDLVASGVYLIRYTSRYQSTYARLLVVR